MKYYIPLRKEENKFLLLDGADWRIVEGTPDPFSRVARPPLKSNWAEGIPLTAEEKNAVLKVKHAYTWVWQED